jgi:CO/xanthine dehydrogenase FAD-binding subunit
MDLISVREIRSPRSRGELVLAPGDTPLGGGTWLFSEPQLHIESLVDLTALGWPEIEETADGITVAATCRIATLARLRERDLGASELFWQTANSLLASFKIWNVATVGGNMCFSVPAGPMASLGAALDAVAVIWRTDVASDDPRAERRVPVAEFVTGVQTNALAPGEVLRAIEYPRHALESRTGFRRIALAQLGRSGTLVTGRRDASGEFVMSVTAGTTHPWVFRFDEVPTPDQADQALDAIDDWYDDPHGAPDWREAMSRRFAAELAGELHPAHDRPEDIR